MNCDRVIISIMFEYHFKIKLNNIFFLKNLEPQSGTNIYVYTYYFFMCMYHIMHIIKIHFELCVYIRYVSKRGITLMRNGVLVNIDNMNISTYLIYEHRNK